MDGNHAPMPPHSTEKTYYQSRKGVTPTRNMNMAISNPVEGAMRSLYHGHEEAYTSINDRAPTAMERGFAPNQASMGKYNNGFKPNV